MAQFKDAMISRMWLVTFVDFSCGWSLWVFLTWLPSYLLEARGFDVAKTALFTFLPLVAGVTGNTLGGVTSDRIYKATATCASLAAPCGSSDLRARSPFLCWRSGQMMPFSQCTA
jgi:sugar phosphate permease